MQAYRQLIAGASANRACRQSGATQTGGEASSTSYIIKSGRLMKPKSRKARSQKKAPAAATPKKCRIGLLDLSPEIRNRIYHFATEMRYYGWVHAPPMFARNCFKFSCPDNRSPWSARNFFGLTQACKQIRAEYRPLWMRNSSVRLQPYQIFSFLRTFYPQKEDYKNAPNLLQISWTDNEDGMMNTIYELIELLELRAHCSTAKIEFVPHAIAEGDGPTDMETCGICVEEILENKDFDSDDCPHKNLYFSEWMDALMDEHFYILPLNKFLAIRNASWLTHIREGKVSAVDFIYASRRGGPTVSIFLTKDALEDVKGRDTMHGFAEEYLKQMGITKAAEGIACEVCFRV